MGVCIVIVPSYMHFNKGKQITVKHLVVRRRSHPKLVSLSSSLSMVCSSTRPSVLLVLIALVSFQSSELRYTANTQLEHRKSSDFVRCGHTHIVFQSTLVIPAPVSDTSLPVLPLRADFVAGHADLSKLYAFYPRSALNSHRCVYLVSG